MAFNWSREEPLEDKNNVRSVISSDLVRTRVKMELIFPNCLFQCLCLVPNVMTDSFLGA